MTKDGNIYIYIYINTGSSQLTPHGSYIRIIHGVPHKSSMYYIIIDHFFSHFCVWLFCLAIVFVQLHDFSLKVHLFVDYIFGNGGRIYKYCSSMINNKLYISWRLNCVIPSIFATSVKWIVIKNIMEANIRNFAIILQLLWPFVTDSISVNGLTIWFIFKTLSYWIGTRLPTGSN